jgi:hypothetical protein
MLSTRQRRHSSGPKMLQFDLEQVRGFGRLASNWETAVVFGCCTKTLERARKQTASGFEAAYQKGQHETMMAVRNKLLERALKGNSYLLWKLAMNRLGYVDNSEQVISIGKSSKPPLTIRPRATR